MNLCPAGSLRNFLAATFLCATLIVSSQTVQAKGPPEPLEVSVQIVGASGKLAFRPQTLAFKRGQLYKLVINNATDKSRYFTATDFSTRVFSRKVEVLDHSGAVIAEVHGQANNFELSPGGTVAWYFFPMINGSQLSMQSQRRDEAAIAGTLDISGPPPIIKSK